MPSIRLKTKFVGVFYSETTNPQRTHNGRPDRAYKICWTEFGQKRWKTIGWASEGITAQLAHNERLSIISKHKQRGLAGSYAFDKVLFTDEAEAYFEDRRARGLYSSTDESRYKKHILPYFQHRKLSDIHAQMAGDFRRHILKNVPTPASQRKIFSVARAVIFFALKEHHWEGINAFSKAGGFKMPFEDNKSERYLTKEEATTLLDALLKVSPQLHDMALLSLTTGLRPTEVFGIKGNDLDIENNQIWITQKGHKRGCVKVPFEVMKRLTLYGRQGDEFIFPSRKGTRLSKVSATFDRVAKRIGLNDVNTPRHKKVIFHTLRHTFASWLAQQEDVSMQEIQQLMRHESIDMTFRYSHMQPNQGWKKAKRVYSILKDTPPHPEN